MSHFRRNQGRFSANTASEAYQRQLATPVHKWKKAWVSPTGLQPESSYKICKWVRVPKDEQDGHEDEGEEALDEDDEMNEGDDNENEDEEGEGEDQGEGDGDGDGDGEGDGDGDGDGDDEGDGEGEGDDDGDEGGMDAEDSQQAEVPAQATQLDQNQAIASASGETNQAPLETLTELPEPSNVPSTLKPDTVDSEGRSLADASTPLEPAGSAAITHTEIPSNAMEISNVAPGHTEEGQGDLGTSDAGIAVKLPEPATGDVEMGEAPANAEVADSAPRVDEGLVHGESNLPEGLGDGAPPPEVEKQP